MDLNLQSLDTFSLVDKLSTAFATEICEDGRISILTDNNIFVYTLMNYMGNEFFDMGFKKNVINIPKSSLREELGTDFGNICDNSGEECLNRMMQNLNLNQFLENPSTLDVKPINLKWSPRGLQGKSYCVIAVLNNFYGLSIMIEHSDVTDCKEYSCVTNVTKYIVEKASKEWSDKCNLYGKTTQEEWEKRVMATCPKAFIWSHIIDNNYAILFVAHPNGSVTSWKFTRVGENDLQSKPLEFLGTYMSSLKNISTMHWIKYGGNEGALCLGNNEGKLSAVRVSNINPQTIIYAEEKVLSGKDIGKKINYINSLEYDSYSFLITADEELLYLFPVLEDGTVLEEILYNTGGTATTGICHYKDNILLLLTAGRLKKLTLKIIDSKGEIEEENVPINFDATVYKSCGIVLSKNKVFLGIVAYPCCLRDISRHPTPSKFFVYHDASIDPLGMILNNTDKSLADFWDIFEVLRMLSYKEKRFPWQGIKDIDYDQLTLPQLKSLRWIAKMSEIIYNIVPRIHGYQIKAYILLHHLVTIQLVVNRMKKLLNDIFQGKQLTLFQMRSLDISNMYLKEIVLMKILQKCKVGERFVDDIISVMEMANELEYPDMPPCFWCGEKIIGPTCLRSHKDSRCSISMMQIYLTPGFKCPFCDCVAHIEIAKEFDVVTCPYCDVPMYERYSLKNVQNTLEDTDVLTRRQIELSLRADIPEDICPRYDVDRIQDDNISLDSLEDPIEYLALSDSEEEEATKERVSSLQKEFFDPSNKTIDEAPEMPEGLDDSYIKQDGQSKENDSSDDYSYGEDEYEDQT